MNRKIKKLTATGMLCALAYAAAAIGRIPLVLFLKYDPKDSVIAVGGLIFGPVTSWLIALAVSFVEMFTISETGIWGFFMNVISSCSFACTPPRSGFSAVGCVWFSSCFAATISLPPFTWAIRERRSRNY